MYNMRMQSTRQQNLTFFKEIILNASQLAMGESLIVNYLLSSQMHRNLTLLNILSPSPPILALIGNIYPQSVWHNLQQSQQAQTRKYLLQTAADLWMRGGGSDGTIGGGTNTNTTKNTNNISVSLRVMIKRINDVQGWRDWIGQYESVLQKMLQGGFAGTAAFVVEMIRNADDRVSQLALHLLPLTMKGIINGQPPHLIQLIYYCIKPMAVLSDTDPVSIEEVLLPWISTIWQLILTHIKSSPIALRFSLKIITVLIGEYQIQCDKSIHETVEEVGREIIREYTKWCESAQEVNEQEEGEGDREVNWEGIMYQLLQLACTLNQSSFELSAPVQSSLLISSTLLPLSSFISFSSSSDLYFLTLQEEGERRVRNRALQMLTDIQQSRYKGRKTIMDVITEYCTIVLQYIKRNAGNTNTNTTINTNTNTTTNELQSSLNALAHKHKLTIGQANGYVFAESAMYILLSFTTIVPTSVILPALSTHIQTQIGKPKPYNITMVTALALINTLCSKLQGSQKQMYFQFLRNMIISNTCDIGVLLAAIRGFTAAAGATSMGNTRLIGNQPGSVPVKLFAQLSHYISHTDGYQSQSCHLVLSFLLQFLPIPSNVAILSQLITPPLQLHLYTHYLHDGMTSDALIQVLAVFNCGQLIGKVWESGRYGKGDEQWSKLIAKWINTNALHLSEMDIYNLIQCYHSSSKQEQIAPIVLAYLMVTTSIPTTTPLLTYLNKFPHPSWLLTLLTKGLLNQPQELFLRTTHELISVITSQHQFECRLILVYWAVLKWNGLSIWEREGMVDGFMTKFIRYAQLFRGDHLRIMTAHFLFAIMAIYPMYTPGILSVVKLYGQPTPSEWEDEQGDDQQDDIIEKMMGGKGFINDQVEKWMIEGFGELAWDAKAIQEKLVQFK